MIRKILLVFACVPLACSAVAVEDSFDWGTGVAGREAVTAGTAVDGQQAQTGGPAWAINTAANAVFGGTAGAGGGQLLLSDGNPFER